MIPRVNTKSQSIYSPISKCGDNWWKDVRVRCPYRGIDSAFRTLPSLGDPIQVESIDAAILDEMMIDHGRIHDFFLENIDELNDSQRAIVEIMLARAVSYIDDARRIFRLWRTGFETESNGKIPPLPLNDSLIKVNDSNIEEGRKRDSDKWKRLVRAALRNLRCAEESAKKATIYQRNKEKMYRSGRF